MEASVGIFVMELGERTYGGRSLNKEAKSQGEW
jgi:hypothetical protein